MDEKAPKPIEDPFADQDDGLPVPVFLNQAADELVDLAAELRNLARPDPARKAEALATRLRLRAAIAHPGEDLEHLPAIGG